MLLLRSVQQALPRFRNRAPSPSHILDNIRHALRPRLELNAAKKLAKLVLVFGLWLIMVCGIAVVLGSIGLQDSCGGAAPPCGMHDVVLLTLCVALLLTTKVIVAVCILCRRIDDCEYKPDGEEGYPYSADDWKVPMGPGSVEMF